MKKLYFFLSVMLMCSVQSTRAQEYVPDPSTVALYHFNETSGSTVNDTSSNGYNGTATGTTIVDGEFGRARTFNGNGDIVTLPSSIAPSQITLEAWIYNTGRGHDPANRGQAIITKEDGHGNSPNLAWRLYIQPNTFKLNAIMSNGTSDVRVDSKGTIELNTWYHVAATYDGSSVKLYINGLIDTTVAASLGALNPTTSLPLSIGGMHYFVGGTLEWFEGIIDEVRISNIARTSFNMVPDSIPLPGIAPGGVTWDGSKFWVADWYGDSISALYRTGEIVRKVAAPHPSPKEPAGLTWDGSYLWHTDGNAGNNPSDHDLFKMNPVDGSVDSSYTLPTMSPRDITFDGQYFWYVDFDEYKLVKVTTSGALVSQYGLSIRPSCVEYANGELYVGTPNNDDQIYQYDPITGDSITSYTMPFDLHRVTGLAWDGNYLWITNDERHKLFKFEIPIGTLPAATTTPATGVGSTTATLHGTVNPNGDSATVNFQYGTTTGYGNEIAATPYKIGGTDSVSVSAPLTGLSPSLTYHYRVVATNSHGTTYGADQTFLTKISFVPGFIFTNNKINDQANPPFVNLSPEESFTVSFDYQIWDVDNPNAVWYISVGIDTFPQVVAYSGIPGFYPGALGSATVTLTAPSTPGTYQIRLCASPSVSQPQAFQNYQDVYRGFGYAAGAIGMITVGASNESIHPIFYSWGYQLSGTTTINFTTSYQIWDNINPSAIWYIIAALDSMPQQVVYAGIPGGPQGVTGTATVTLTDYGDQQERQVYLWAVPAVSEENAFANYRLWWPNGRYQAGSVNSTFTLTYNGGWNIVSIPLNVNDCSKRSLFPSAASDAFSYQRRYVSCDTLEMGKGYWVKFREQSTLILSGARDTVDTIDVNARWNLIGSLSSPIPVNHVGSIPSGLVTSFFWGYNPVSGEYTKVDTIEPGRGYWVKVRQSGKLVFSSAGTVQDLIKITADSELPPMPPAEIGSHRDQVSKEFTLGDNYPNPFNPTTNVEFSLPSESFVSLNVYNALGVEVANLISETLKPGTYKTEWNASGFASGVYFYRLTAGTFVETKKLILLK